MAKYNNPTKAPVWMTTTWIMTSGGSQANLRKLTQLFYIENVHLPLNSFAHYIKKTSKLLVCKRVQKMLFAFIRSKTFLSVGGKLLVRWCWRFAKSVHLEPADLSLFVAADTSHHGVMPLAWRRVFITSRHHITLSLLKGTPQTYNYN